MATITITKKHISNYDLNHGLINLKKKKKMQTGGSVFGVSL